MGGEAKLLRGKNNKKGKKRGDDRIDIGKKKKRKNIEEKARNKITEHIYIYGGVMVYIDSSSLPWVRNSRESFVTRVLL